MKKRGVFLKLTKANKYLLLLGMCLGIGIFVSKGMVIPVKEKDNFNWDTIHVYGKSNVENSKIYAQMVNNEKVMILPSAVSPNAVELHWEEEGEYSVSVQPPFNA